MALSLDEPVPEEVVTQLSGTAGILDVIALGEV
jgi:hypothetical protein